MPDGGVLEGNDEKESSGHACEEEECTRDRRGVATREVACNGIHGGAADTRCGDRVKADVKHRMGVMEVKCGIGPCWRSSTGRGDGTSLITRDRYTKGERERNKSIERENNPLISGLIY